MILIILLVGLGAVAPRLILSIKKARRQRLLASQLRQSLQNMVHALRVGVGFLQALDYIAQEGEKPLVTEWQWLLQAVRVGKPLTEAVGELSQRVPIKEMKWFVSAVQITQSTGGSLAEVLDTLANTLQEQETLREKIGALTAQGKASGLVLGCVPFLVMAAMTIMAPEMMRPVFTTVLGQLMVAAVVISVTLGGLVIRKIVTIQVD